MSLAPSVKGWCPTLLSPMQSGDGWLARVKPSAATLSAEEARFIAQAAQGYGNGHIDLTSRANLQIRGLSLQSAGQFAREILAKRLASPDPSVEQVRNVMASPLGPDDPAADFDSHALARQIEATLGAEPALSGLPHKFGFLVDAGGLLPLAGVTADIMLRAHRGEFALQLDGSDVVALCERSAGIQAAKALALAFLSLGSAHTKRPARMRALVMAVGADALFDAASLKISHRQAPLALAPRLPIGFIPYPGKDHGAFGVGLPFGRVEAASLNELATLAARLGDATLRLTPWRVLILAGIAAADAVALAPSIRRLGLIADAGDPRLGIFACPGKPACQSASVDARADAETLAAARAADGLSVHISGCAKSCAHRGPASFTLVGRDGRYDLVRNGGAGDQPVRTGLTIEDAVAMLGQERSRP